ncbi:TIGR00725 family protein [Desulforhabdus amnigena]|uniref:TIGR00725 family protein n=2 Tax=Desulforhabdus amnigena TaxID=40218 RepID=A0A9W6FUL7_9BACT|nr:TIGR00725 family protein [Desulforhabdus amnigena]
MAGMSRKPFIGVVGAGTSSPAVDTVAAEVGREIARHGAVLICGGLGGVMTAAARGAKEAGGWTIGILPGPSIDQANDYIDFPIATHMGQARNAIIVQTAHVVISVAGGYGTLSEISMALKIGKPVVALLPRFSIPGVVAAQNPGEAVQKAIAHLRPPYSETISI